MQELTATSKIIDVGTTTDFVSHISDWLLKKFMINETR